MRVFHLETGRHVYGGALQVLYLVRGLNERGIHSDLVVPENSSVADAARTWGLPLHTFPYRGEADLTAVPRLIGLLRRLDPDLVHLHSRRGADTLGTAAARLSGLPVVLTRRVDNPEAGWSVGVKYAAFRHVIVISRVIQTVLHNQGVPPAKTTLVHSGIDVSEWEAPEDRAALEAEFGLPADVPAGAMVAQFIERKGHEVLLRALGILNERGVAPSIVLFGQGPLMSDLQALATELGVDHRVTFAGFRNDLPRWLGAFDFAVHPASKEGLGLAVLQAGAACLPVIGARAGGVPEVIVDGETGLLVEGGQPEALAEAIERISNSPDEAGAMGLAGHRRVSERFSVEQMVAGNLAVYEAVLDGRGGGAL